MRDPLPGRPLGMMNTAAPAEVLERIKKLLNLASKNSSEGEAASAAAKAQELLAAWNLDVATVDSAAGGDGKREEAKVKGGFYRWQRRLWYYVAEINFCLHWTGEKYSPRTYRRNGVKRTANYVKVNHLVGRRVNVAATQHMAQYLEQAIERLLNERTGGLDNSQRLGNWAVSYRTGVSERIIEKLVDRRNIILREEDKNRCASQDVADRNEISTSTSITLRALSDRERDANFDHIYGEGWSARCAAEAAEAHAKREAYVKWAAEHPEEAAAEAKKQRKVRRSGAKAPRNNLDGSAYWSGYEEGEAISLDEQVDRSRVAGLL